MNEQVAKQYPVPSFDRLRVRNLRSLQILDSAPEPFFDELVRLATVVAETPIAAISLVDQDRQWFKARIGIDSSETSRDISFCTHTILRPSEPFLVVDASKSETFKNNPLVVGDTHFRSYLGVPISSPDHNLTIGSLCVIDRVPRLLTNRQVELVMEIARSVEKAIAVRAGIWQLK